LYGGLLLVSTAYIHLVREPEAVGGMAGPGLAFLLDGGLAFGIVLLALVLARSAYPTADRTTLALFGVGGGLVFTLAMLATVSIRLAEGRGVSEVSFVVATSLGAGFLAGAVGGEYRVQARREAREAARSRDALAFVNGMLRHDVRNDANVIAGYAERVEEGRAATVLRERAETVLERTEQARAVVGTVTGDEELSPMDPVPVVEAAVDSARRSFANVTWETSLAEGVAVAANESLRPVVDNLVENAVEHHDRDDPVVRVAVERAGDTVRITVADDGPGLDAPPERLFDHDSPGTAKGLHVVDTIVTGLGGRVVARDRRGEPTLGSDDDRGAVFVVELPAVDETADAESDPFGAAV
jgi:signal transduction histidine kinase